MNKNTILSKVATYKTLLKVSLISLLTVFSLFTAANFVFATDATVANEAELTAALLDVSTSTITLANDITLTSHINVTRNVNIDGAGFMLTRTTAPSDNFESYAVMVSSGTLTASNLKIVSNNTGTGNAVGITVQSGASLSLSNSTTTAEAAYGLVYGVYAQGANTITLNSNSFIFSGTDTTTNAHRIMLGAEGIASTLSLTSNTITSTLHSTQQEIRLMVNATGSTLADIKTYAVSNLATGEKLRATASDAVRTIYTKSATGWAIPVANESELTSALAGPNDIVLSSDITLINALDISRTVVIDGSTHTISGKPITITAGSVTLKNATTTGTENVQPDGNYGIMVQGGSLVADNINMTVVTSTGKDNDGFNVASGASLEVKNSTITLTGTTDNQHGVYTQSGAVAVILNNNTFNFPTRVASPYSYLISMQGATTANYPTLTLTGTNTNNAYIKLFLVGDDTVANKQIYAATGDKVAVGERLGEMLFDATRGGIYVRTSDGWGKRVTTEEALLTALADSSLPIIVLSNDITLTSALDISRTVIIDGSASEFTLSGKPVTISGAVTLKNMVLTGTENVQSEGVYGIMIMSGSLTADNISMTVNTVDDKNKTGFSVANGASLNLSNSAITVVKKHQAGSYGVYAQSGATSVILNTDVFTMTEEANGNSGYTHLIGTEGSYAGTITVSGGSNTAEVKLLLATGDEAAAKAYAELNSKVATGEKLRTLATPVVFTKTADGWTQPITATAIAGVTRPVLGATPVTSVTAGTGYTGTVTWNPSPVTFASATVYTATITLTATAGYTLTGVTTNQFTVAEATTTNSANSGVITAEFPATASTDATLSAASTVKGQTLLSLGTPSATIGSATGGAVTITAAKAANTTETDTFVTSFIKSHTNAGINKVVKYANGASTANFETSDPTYGGTAITNGDFFIVKVTAEDNTTILYYKIVVTVPAQSGNPAFTLGAPATYNTQLTVGSDTLTTTTNLTYTWYRSADNAVGGDTLLTTGTTYTPVENDIGNYIIVVATSPDVTGSGFVASVAVVSKAAAPATPSAPTEASKTATSITLTPAAGNEFSINGAIWQDSNVFSGLTALTSYTFKNRVKETTTTFASLESASSSAVITNAPVMAGTLAIAGTAKYGQTLTANIAGVTYTPATGADVPTYQWKRGGSDIALATTSTYVLGLADIGSVITVTLTSDGVNATGNVTSAGTSAVTKADGPAATTAALNVVGNLITNTLATMEYSTNNGVAWANASDPTTSVTFADGQHILVRVASTTTTFEGVSQDLGTLSTPAAPSSSGVTFSVLTGTVSGLGTTYEYSLNNGAWSTVTTSVPFVAGTVRVRSLATASALVSDPHTLTTIAAAPAAPTTALNIAGNLITGTLTTMEYSINNGGAWTAASNTTTSVTFVVDQHILIRVAATDSALVGATQDLGTILAAPVINTVTTDDIINASEKTATVTVTGTKVSGTTVTLNGNATTPTGATTWSYVLDANAITAFGQGAETLTASSTDGSGGISLNGTKNITVDTVVPTATPVTIASNNASTTLAKIGNDVVVSFSISETAAVTPTATIAGIPATVANVSGLNYTATLAMAGGETEAGIPFTLDFTDMAGNGATQVTAVTSGAGVTFDKTAPTITPQSDIVLEATSAAGATTTYSLATSDALSGAGFAVCSPTSGAQFAFGSTTVTCTKSDAAGNSATPATFVVGVYDTTIPTITRSGNAVVTLEINTPYVDLGATAVDAVDGNMTNSIVTSTSSVNNALVGSYTVTYNVTDAHGNAATQVTRTVNVVDSIDTAFNGISSTIRSAGIVNNMDDITTNNIQAFSGLYFEKRGDVNATSTALGRITFTSELDLSNGETQAFLQNLGSKLTANGVGVLGLDFSAATSSNKLKGVSASMRFYNMTSLGFAATSTAEEINAKLVAYDDAGLSLDKTDLVSTSTPATYLGACEVNGPCYIFTVPVNHFTTYKVDTVAPTVTKMGDNSADVTLTAGTHNLVFSEKLSATAKTAVQNALTLGADTALSYGWTEGTLTITASSLTTFANDVLANISDIAGNATNNALLVDSVLSATQSTPDNNGNVTVSSTTPEVVITNGNATTTVTISSDNTNPTIDVSSFIGSNGTGTLPAINITSSNASNMTVAIPAGTEVVSASTTWNGVIAAPTVTTTSLPPVDGQTKTLSTAIEIGFSGAKLTFSKAVKILLPGQAGKRAGYVRTGTAFTEITNVCASDSQVTGDALAADSECKIDVGSDLVIWTKHFTTFASYTQVLNPSGSWFVTSSGGSSGSTAPAAASPVVTANPTTSIAQIAPVGQVLGASVFNFLTDLRLGDKNNDVTELQKILIAGGLLKSEATGYFGALTKSALAKWQANNNLSATGLFNKASRDLVSGIVSAPTAKVAGVAAFNFLKDLRMGMKNDNVTELQKILIAEGLLNSEATGYFGSQTRAALAKWQAKNGLPSTGFFGSLSRAKLNK